MAWLAAAVVLVLLVVSTGFRKFAFGGAALVIGGGFLYYQYSIHERAEEKARSLKLISQNEVALENVALKSEYSSYSLVGRARNSSKAHTLNSLELLVRIQDCAVNAERTCVTIGETTETLYVDIPPGQARDFDKMVFFSGGAPKPKGQLQWNYSVQEIRGK